MVQLKTNIQRERKEKKMVKWRYIFVVFVLLVLAGLFLAWYFISRKNYSRTIKPGETYKVKDREYKMPDVPVVENWNKTPSKNVKVYILSESFLQEMRELMISVHDLLESVKVPYMLAGGTLLGFAGPYGTFMPYDDDIDLHTFWEHRTYLFSSEFAQEAKKQNLEVLTLLNSSLSMATKEGAAIRLRKRGSITPVCDIFFEKDRINEKTGEKEWVKIDAWFGESLTWSSREIWKEDSIFPLEKKTVDHGMKLFFPAKPMDLLFKQYSPKVFERHVPRSLWISHETAYRLLRVWRVRE